MKPEIGISEIGVQVGYQPLSQLNRSFVRFTGNSPTGVRRRESMPAQGANSYNRDEMPPTGDRGSAFFNTAMGCLVTSSHQQGRERIDPHRLVHERVHA